MVETKNSNFKKLTKEINRIVQLLHHKNLINKHVVINTEILDIINQSAYLITIHDVKYYTPVCINNKMKQFYGFQENWFRGIKPIYYLKTIHPSTYHTLIESISFFKRNTFEYLNLEYKLLYKKIEWKTAIGTSKVLSTKDNELTKYAITVACRTNQNNNTNLIEVLTKREKEIAGYLIKGFNNTQIS